MQCQSLCDILEYLNCFKLFRAVAWDQTSLDMPGD
jgi:hypothetical protein